MDFSGRNLVELRQRRHRERRERERRNRIICDLVAIAIGGAVLVTFVVFLGHGCGDVL